MVLCCEPHEITGLSMLSPTTAGEEGREEGEGGGGGRINLQY